MTKAVAKKKDTPPSNVVDFAADAGGGFEEADKDSYAVPFVRILQSGSPQCKKSDGAYVKGAEEGAIFNTATGEIMESLDVIPCHYRRVFVEWIPQDEGGGFVAEHSVDEARDIPLDENYRMENGHELADTRMHYCISAETGEPLVICMSSTQIKKSKNWMTVMQSIKVDREDGSKFTPPMFSNSYKIETVPESNDKGSWFGWKITRNGFVEDGHLYQTAKAFRDMVVSGATEVKHDDGFDEDVGF